MKTFIALLLIGTSLYAQPVPYSAINTRLDDYAPAFRTTAKGTEIWYTTGTASSRKIIRAVVGASEERSALPVSFNQPLNDATLYGLDGCPTFSFCHKDTGIFVSNRLINGKNFENDLYEMVNTGNELWSVKRLDIINSPSWEDTPFLSPDGNTLYFSSDRLSPGSGKTDIFYSKKVKGEWTYPVPFENINTREYAEQNPCVGSDGYLYYATNNTEGGDYDIWRVLLNSNKTAVAGAPEPLRMEGVNKEGSDEGHPLFSPGENYFIFSSNAGPNGKKDYDIYYVKLREAVSKTLTTNVLLRTQEYDRSYDQSMDMTIPVSTSIFATDLVNGKEFNTVSGKNGVGTMTFSDVLSGEPSDDVRMREFIVHALPVSGGVVSSADTVAFDVTCGNNFSHTLYLWDTTVLARPECKQTFPTTNVQFFITGYWCPTTKQFANYAPCASVFPDDNCMTLDFKEPEVPCENDELRRYAVQFTAPKVIRSTPPGLCIDWGEANAKRGIFASAVDAAITTYIRDMRAALQIPCVQKAILNDSVITIEITGWTDPRGISSSCRYTGADIDFKKSPVILKDLDKKSYMPNGLLKSGTFFSESGASGNQLLSDLRAYYTAAMLDAVWQDSIPQYKELRLKNTGINIIATGRAISTDPGKAYERQRSVTVSISAPAMKREALAGKIAEPGEKHILCSPCEQGQGDYQKLSAIER